MPYLHSNTAGTVTAPVDREMARDLANLTATALAPVVDGERFGREGQECEQKLKAEKGEAEDGSSRPPSPPSSGTTTPTLRIAPCPPRLKSYVPPPQYGVVDDFTIYRSSYPQDRNMDFIKSMDIKSILTLVATEPSPEYVQWLTEYNIRQCKVTIAPNKEAKEGKDASSTSVGSICEALLFVMDAANHPIWIHCNQGRHRTGCVVACLRKIQGAPMEEVIQEYTAYASPKARPGDIALIKSFEPEALFTYAKETGFIGGSHPTFRHSGPADIANVYQLACALALSGRQDSLTSAIDNISSTLSDVSMSDESETGLAMANSSDGIYGGARENVDPRLLAPVEAVVSMEDVREQDMGHVERLALLGELDPSHDADHVAATLSTADDV